MMTIYITKAGDTFDSIAHKQIGNKKHTHILIEANTQYITTVIFSAGIKLNIPNIDEAEDITEEALPPWRR